jgi:hypothetical protein
MEFSQAGLSNHPLVEQAFNISYARATEGESLAAAVRAIRQNMESWYNETLQFHQKTTYDKAEQAEAKRRLDGEYSNYLSGAEDLAKNILESDFSLLHLQPALEILDYAENTPPHVLAAALLMPGVHSDEDVREIAAAFGPDTGGIVQALYHIKDDPDSAGYTAPDLADFKDDPVDPQHEVNNLAAASDEIKTVYFARLTSLLRHEAETTRALMRQNPQEEVSFEKGREEKLYAIGKAVAGVNPEIDRRFRDAFNELASLTGLPLRLSVDRVDDLILGPFEEPIPQKVKPKEKRSNEPPPIDVMD